jgi:hypothetical protein
MASGKPLTDREKAFIAANRTEKFPTIIARHLSLYFSSENNGSRSTRCVQEYIRELNRKEREVQEVKPSPSSPPNRPAGTRAKRAARPSQ